MSPSEVDGRRRAVFLDRDGVLIRAVVRDGRPNPVASAAEVELLPGVAAACDALRRAGFLLVVVTNQPDLARRAQTRSVVDAINDAVRARLPIDEVRLCPHEDADGCACRKPKPGLLLAAARAANIDLAASVMVGDRWRDVEAGRAAGCRTVFVDHGYDERRPAEVDVDAVAPSLADAVPWILARR